MKEYKLTVEFHNGQRFCYYGKTKKQAIAEFKRNFGNFKGFIKKEWEIIKLWKQIEFTITKVQ